MKLLHTADIHLGTTTYGRLDPETGLNVRLLDYKRSFEAMVDRALEEEIDVFLFCGDAYRSANPSPTQQQLFAECLRPLADADIPIVMITGNHDHPVSFGKASSVDIFQHLAGKVTVFRTPDVKQIETKSGPLQVIALPWPIRSMLLSREEHRAKSPAEVRDVIEKMYLQFLERALEERIDRSLPTVLAAHLTVQGAHLAGSERTSLIAHEPRFTVGQLARPDIDYVALGHIHHHQNLNAGNQPPVVYSSSIERVSFKEADERKGFVLVTIEGEDTSRTTSLDFVETPARRFVSLEVDARESTEPTEHILRALEKKDVEDAIVRVRYHVNEAQMPLVDTAHIREALEAAFRVAAIERVVEPVERRRRTALSTEAGLHEAMEQYIAQRDDLKDLKDDLLQAALEIEEELTNHEH